MASRSMKRVSQRTSSSFMRPSEVWDYRFLFLFIHLLSTVFWCCHARFCPCVSMPNFLWLLLVYCSLFFNVY